MNGSIGSESPTCPYFRTRCTSSPTDAIIIIPHPYSFRNTRCSLQYGLNVHPHVATVTYLSDLGGPTVVLEHTSSVEVGQDFSGSVDRVFMR